MASSLNYTAGVTGGNDPVIGVSGAGTICTVTLTEVHLVADVSGFTEPRLLLAVS